VGGEETVLSSVDWRRNGVLARLDDSQFQQLMVHGERIDLEQGAVLHRFGSPTENLLFPLRGMISLTIPTPAGENVEVALVGREGMFGVSRLFGREEGDLEAIAQVAGEAISISADRISDEGAVGLRRAVETYSTGLLIELAQTAACNRLHSVEERTARWLLHAADRADTADLQLTHEFLAMMLGVRRASVTVVVGGFESAGLISAGRRRIGVADRARLLGYACTCYEVIRNATVFPSHPGPSA